jgi:hypothetical protein
MIEVRNGFLGPNSKWLDFHRIHALVTVQVPYLHSVDQAVDLSLAYESLGVKRVRAVAAATIPDNDGEVNTGQPFIRDVVEPVYYVRTDVASLFEIAKEKFTYFVLIPDVGDSQPHSVINCLVSEFTTLAGPFSFLEAVCRGDFKGRLRDFDSDIEYHRREISGATPEGSAEGIRRVPELDWYVGLNSWARDL